MITIGEFAELCLEPSMCSVDIFSLEEGEKVYEGNLSDLPQKYHDCEIASFDAIYNDNPVLTINID